MSKSPITCHVLDSTLGRPGKGVKVYLERLSSTTGGAAAEKLAEGETDSDGRCTTLLVPETKLPPGAYRMRFETGAYFAKDGRPTFYPFVEVTFTLPNRPDQHYHIPLLLSPFSYTTYRGS
ncbi:Hydroxyisourate hydrolase [Tilletiaria anomala UBC 951]|uniref:5-hydroxyisourate hydrolase n=1 Tax=Tilletiaria anomala (strain ATCC 24038 / CBS 436.72 / UBC 951) TaxID=1037660 RepID=A0A066WIF0_TILAU|nr:Hydroxyisourate hydrolase [Tilletiaria anomala UBC 951]KDN52298.1 Hydroxyisourate hydrolase [Tilletiaria anomala UBC 951]